MKIIIDTDKKELVLIGLVTLDEINAFCRDHNLMGYSISSTDTSTHWYRGWQPSPLDPPYKITCTDPTVSHVDQIFDAPKVGGFEDEVIKSGYYYAPLACEVSFDPKDKISGI